MGEEAEVGDKDGNLLTDDGDNESAWKYGRVVVVSWKESFARAVATRRRRIIIFFLEKEKNFLLN